MNKISYGQLTALLLASDTFTLVCLTGNITAITAAGFITGIAIQILASLPALSCSLQGEKIINSIGIQWIYLLFTLLWGGLLFVRVWQTSEEIYIPSVFSDVIPHKLIITALIGIICLYVSSPGIKALSRAAVVVAGFGVLCLVIIILGAADKISFSYLTIKSSAGFAAELIKGLALSGSLGTFVILLEIVKDNKIKTTVFYFICKAILTCIVLFITTLVSGGIMSIVNFPVITAAQLSQPFSNQRTDSAFIIILVILAVISIALQATAASIIIKKIFPKFSRFRCSTALIIMSLAGLALSRANLYSSIFALIFALVALIPPAVVLVKTKGESK